MSKKSRRAAAARATLTGAVQPQAARVATVPRREANAKRRRLGLWLGGLAAALAIASAVFVVNLVSGTSPTVLAGTDGQAQGQPVDGITCDTSEQVVYHIHAHLAVYANGKTHVIPEGIGIAPPTQVVQTSAGPFVSTGKCFYWLHSHTADGIIHIESPSQRVYTLGTYFDVWNQPLSASQVGPVHGAVTAYVNGQTFTGDPRSIPLNDHTLIQLDVGSSSPGPQPFSFPAGL